MAIFPNLKLESVVQENDKTRLDGRGTFTVNEADISLVEIDPGDGSGYQTITLDPSLTIKEQVYLDWQYSTEATYTVNIRITTDGAPVVASSTLDIISAANDMLFSDDSELSAHEPDILNWVRDGRNSWLDVHRLAQERILTRLDEQRIWDSDGNRLTKDRIINHEEVNEWSKYLTLKLIFEGLSNAVDDIFNQKAMKYREMVLASENRAVLRYDRDGDGTEDVGRDLRTTDLSRR